MADADEYLPYSETKYWDREYKLLITQGEEELANYSTVLQKANYSAIPFDIRFDITSTGNISPTFTIDILGLSATTMNKLLNWNVGTTFNKNIKIQLFAGYVSVGTGPLPLIAQGIVTQAFPISSPPEVWFRFRCITNGEFGSAIIKPKYEAPTGKSTDSDSDTSSDSDSDGLTPETESDEFKASEAIQKELNVVANKLGANSVDIKDGVLDWVGDNITKLIDSVGKTATQLAQDIMDKYNVVVSFVQEVGATASEVVKSIVCYTKNKPTELAKQTEVQTINAENGLLSVGDLNGGGYTCNITRLLNAECHIGDVCKLESKLMPNYSGKFLITSIRHTGHYRGKEWFTRLSLVKLQEG